MPRGDCLPRGKTSRSDVEKFKKSVKIGDKFFYQLLTGEPEWKRKAAPKFERVSVVKKHSFLVQVARVGRKELGPIKTMTYLELLFQRKGIGP